MEKFRYKPRVEDYERYEQLNKYLLKRFRDAFLRKDLERASQFLSLINKNNEHFERGFKPFEHDKNPPKREFFRHPLGD
ncbi:MAG: hypothetical protein N3D10_03220 [Candidatus Micrarchaeota archaeon]|nr:hypothetical protein [Candidatus Micrarchaeota archaeon]